MQLTNLDMITRRWLLERGLPIHYYLEGLIHASTCLRELALMGLGIVNSKPLLVNEYGAIDLPNDFQDDISVSIPSGQRLINMPSQSSITPLRITDGTGVYIPYSTNGNGAISDLSVAAQWNWYWNVNDYGEPTGRYFGSGGGTNTGYKLLKQRRQIQFSENLIGSTAILIYTGNGQSIDAASQIDWNAHSTIQSYIDWATSPYATDKDSAPARKHYNELNGLAHGIFGMSAETLKNIVRSAYSGFIKN